MDKQVSEATFSSSVEKRATRGKNDVLLLAILTVGIGLMIGCVPFFYSYQHIYLVQLAAFLVLGTACAAVVYKKGIISNEGLASSLLIATVLFIVLGGIYFLKNVFQLFNLFSFTCSFLLPILVIHAWQLYSSAAFQQKPVWFYSEEIPDEPLFVYLENKPFRIKTIIDGVEASSVKAVAPLPIKLGMAIFYVLKKDAELSSGDWRHLFINEAGKAYGWLIYTKSFGFIKTYLQPEETVYENKIRSNSEIIVKRMND